MQRGFRSVTMDDIAQNLKISKKTIYKYFADKGSLVSACVIDHLTHMQSSISAGISNQENAIDEMMKISNCLTEFRKTVQPIIFFELEKYFPSSFKLIKDHRENFVKQIIIKNIERGKAEGIYRDNVDPNFMAALYMSATSFLIESGLFLSQDFTINPLDQFFEYHLRGISSIKGIELLNASKSTQ